MNGFLLAAETPGIEGQVINLGGGQEVCIGDLARQIIDHSEASMRAAIAAAPDGVYTDEVTLEQRDPSGSPIRLVARVEIRGDEVHVDFTGTSPQVDLPINSVYNFTYAYTVFPIKCALHPHLPDNEGCFRPVRLSVPEGGCSAVPDPGRDRLVRIPIHDDGPRSLNLSTCVAVALWGVLRQRRATRR